MNTRTLILVGLLLLNATFATAKMLPQALVAALADAGNNPAALAKLAAANPILAIAVAQEATLNHPARPALIAAAVAQGAPADSAGPVAAAVAVMVPPTEAPAIAAAVAANRPADQAARIGGMVITAVPAQLGAVVAAVSHAVPECRAELVQQAAKRSPLTPDQVEAAAAAAATLGETAGQAGLRAAQSANAVITAR